MSDFYLCEHKEPCCGTCIRATKTELNNLESQLKAVTEERNQFQVLAQSHADAYGNVIFERNALRLRVENFKAKWDEAYKENERISLRIERLEEALGGLIEATIKDSKENNSMSGFTGARLADAKSALEESK